MSKKIMFFLVAFAMIALGAFIWAVHFSQPVIESNIPSESNTQVEQASTPLEESLQSDFLLKVNAFGKEEFINANYENGRLFLKVEDLIKIDTFNVLQQTFDDEYCNIFDLANQLNLALYIDSKSEVLDIYQRKEVMKSVAKGDRAAYIRFEDIMADSPNGREGIYTDQNLEKLRCMADYLYSHGQAFYIAWIPMYKNPQESIENDVSTMNSLYNAHFLYTLDYLVWRDGKIGLHGYTHQEDDQESSVGNEFGKTSKLSSAQMEQRMLKAKAMCQKLGYINYFFEFPHYATTKASLKLAETHFDVIYQQKQNVKDKGHIETSKYQDRIIKYVPTPAEYVYSSYDKQGIQDRIAKCDTQNKLVSLFFHPRLEYFAISVKVDGEYKEFSYHEEGFIPTMFKAITERGYVFTTF